MFIIREDISDHASRSETAARRRSRSSPSWLRKLSPATSLHRIIVNQGNSMLVGSIHKNVQTQRPRALSMLSMSGIHPRCSRLLRAGDSRLDRVLLRVLCRRWIWSISLLFMKSDWTRCQRAISQTSTALSSVAERSRSVLSGVLLAIESRTGTLMACSSPTDRYELPIRTLIWVSCPNISTRQMWLQMPPCVPSTNSQAS